MPLPLPSLLRGLRFFLQPLQAALDGVHVGVDDLEAGVGVVAAVEGLVAVVPGQFLPRPAVAAARVREHLETGWEPTLTLLEQAMGAGVIRRVSLPVLQRMISASIEDFLADRALDAQGISYTDALDEMISILLEGLLVR